MNPFYCCIRNIFLRNSIELSLKNVYLIFLEYSFNGPNRKIYDFLNKHSDFQKNKLFLSWRYDNLPLTVL